MSFKKFSFRKKGADGKQGNSAGPDQLRTSSTLHPYQEDDRELPPGLARPATAVSLMHGTAHPDPGPLGLQVLYAPDNGHKADIVFIHGLGGASRRTWSMGNKPDLFWPLTFLPLEPDLCLARILSFGYNANFKKAGNVGTAVLDFAKSLLYELRYGENLEQENLNIGRVPLLFVVHSMGGLLVKEAYMQGQNDPNYESIIKAISAIVFLATPHRGSNLADILNKVLQSTVVNNSKTYIAELSRNSFTLQKLNEQFRHVAPKLDIVSFYETRPTSVGLKNASVMILEKDSSLLGYPGETSRALDADHHGVCKYDSREDSNYIAVRNVLKSFVSKIVSTSRSKQPATSTRQQARELKATLAISELPEDDFIFFRDQWTQGTNEWIHETKPFLEWLNTDAKHSFLWINGGSAAGKSVLSSYIINHLIERGMNCEYFFIRFSDQKKRTLSYLLRSLAYQIAQSLPDFLNKVVELGSEGLHIETADPRTIWNRLFVSTLFKMTVEQPLYWVIDGLDEAQDCRSILKLLSEVSGSAIPLRILLVSRNSTEIAVALKRFPREVQQRSLSIEGHSEDLRRHIRQTLTMSGSPDLIESVVERILESSQRNFLWVRLVVEELNDCHTHEAIEHALSRLPEGMEALYDRMAESITLVPDSQNRALALAILQCVTCSFRPLTVAELSQALDHQKLPAFSDFQQSILPLCGGFVVIDNGEIVSMAHQTAREYLLNHKARVLSVDAGTAHEQFFLSSMRCLTSPGLRAKVTRNARSEFLDYSAKWWSAHLSLSKPGSKEAPVALRGFLSSQWVLTWIQILATDHQLQVLIRASKNLLRYLSNQEKADGTQSPGPQIVEKLLVESWAVDFVKLVGKFGANLLRHPESIYKQIPPFCPRNSTMYKQFGKAEERNILVTGLSTQDWDDSVGRFTFGTLATSIAAKGSLVAVLNSAGNVTAYDAATFEEIEASPVKHGARVFRMALNNSGTLLVTYGLKTTKVWDMSNGMCRLTVENLSTRPRPLAMLMSPDNKYFLAATDDRRVRCFDLDDPSPAWKLVAELEEPELEGHHLNAASYMALNQDGSLIAVAYRGHPLSAWEVDGPVHINHCWRLRDEVARGEVTQAVWHPHVPEILGLYIEGVVFKWSPYENEVQELSAGAARLAMSGDGNLFVTGDVRGRIRLYTTDRFTLLYQLAAQDTVSAMTFSPDSRRFYDIRGEHGNAWEPDALMRYAEQTARGSELGDSESDTSSLSQDSAAPVNTFQVVQNLAVLSPSPAGSLYCCGTEYGVVQLFSVKHGKLNDIHVSRGSFSIEKLAWSKDGRFLCFSDSSKKVFLASVDPGADKTKPTVVIAWSISMTSHTKGPILQVLFSPDGNQLLVHTTSTSCVVSVISGSIEYTQEWSLEHCTWAVHPHDDKLLLGFTAGTVSLLDWTLNAKAIWSFEAPVTPILPTNGQDTSRALAVSRVLVTQDKAHILVQLSPLQNTSERVFLHFTTQPLSTYNDADPHDKEPEKLLVPAVLPENLSGSILMALSFLPQNRLIFLSRSLAICSLRVPAASEMSLMAPRPTMPRSNSIDTTDLQETVRFRDPPALRHSVSSDTPASLLEHVSKETFALPGDWTSRDSLAICSMWPKEKSLLCPKNGEIAVIRSPALA